MNDSHEETSDWLQGYVDQSVTFNSWRKVEYKVSQILKQNVEKKLTNPVNRQIIFQILGSDFVSKYFSSYTNSPAVLDDIHVEEKRKKVKEMKTYMFSIINEAIHKNESKGDPKIQADISNFSQELQQQVESNFEDQFSERKAKRQSKHDLHEQYLGKILMEKSNAVEHLIPELKRNVVMLSDNLRIIFWPVCISLKEKSKNIKNSEKIKEKFVHLYSSEKRNENTDKDIESMTQKIIKETKCLNSYCSDESIRSIATILSVCNSYGKKFQSHFIYPAVVTQQIYLKDMMRKNEENYGNASFMLEKLLRLCSLSKDRTGKIASTTHQTLIESDKSLEEHIKRKLTFINGQEKLSHETKIPTDEKSNSLNEDGIVFYLRKWLSTMFVSILKPNQMYFVWDQLHFNKFENNIFRDISLALIGLLKPWFLLAKSKEDIERVFMVEPSLLYILDIRKALLHIQKKGSFHDLPPMNRNIKSGLETAPTPEPIKPIIEPPKPVIAAPKPKTTKPIPTFIPWVPFNKEKKKELNIVKSKVHAPFDLYIDSVRFVPDNATIVKVTGKVLNMYLNQKDKSIKFQTYPELDSFWRYPKFKLKQAINQEALPMNPDVVVMLRVYTVEQHSKNICVLGSCLFGPFSNKHGKDVKLRVGGHQIRIRHGIPDPDFDVENMLASHMDNNPVIPGVTILLRILPNKREYIAAPEYETNYYRSEIAKPNESENKLYNHYKKLEDLSMTVKDAALLVTASSLNSDSAVKQLLQQHLQKEGSDVEDFPYQRYIRYCPSQGMMVLVDKAAGIPLFLEGRYLQCLVQVFPGEDSKIGDGKSQTINFITTELELDSFQRAPDWSDKPKKVYPEYDDRAFILVCLYGLRPRYDPIQEKLLDKDGREPRFNLQQAIAWTAAPCFDKGAVYAGIHHVPLLKGRPPDDIIEKLSYLPLDFICKKFKTQVKVFEAASIEISIWDGHFSNSECPPLSVYNDSLNISKNPSKYIKAFDHKTGATTADLLKSGLPDRSAYNEHKSKMVQLLNQAFKINLDNSLSKYGFKPTI